MNIFFFDYFENQIDKEFAVLFESHKHKAFAVQI